MRFDLKGLLPAMMLATALGGSVFTTAAQAESVGFTWVPSENGPYSSIEDQFNVDVTQGAAANLIDFTFTTTLIGAAVSEIYFYDGAYVSGSGATFVETGNVSYEAGANPGNLPGGNSLPYDLPSLTFAAQADGNTATGLSTGESLKITLQLENGVTLNEVLDALKAGSTETTVADRFFIGLHVRNVDSRGNSASFITPGDTPVVPLPPAVIAGALLMGGTGLMRRVRGARPATA